MPAQWKTSNILPIPKLPHPQAPADYRPISITSVLSRTLERIITTTFIYPTFVNPPVSLSFADQFAFRPTGSPTAAVISLLSTISDLLEVHPFVRVIAIDFSKYVGSQHSLDFLSLLVACYVVLLLYCLFVIFK